MQNADWDILDITGATNTHSEILFFCLGIIQCLTLSLSKTSKRLKMLKNVNFAIKAVVH